MPTVRTTMRPDDELEVSEAEYLDLRRQGLLIEDEDANPATPDETPATPETGAVRTPTARKAVTTDGSIGN